MKRATFFTLGAAATVGCLLLFYGGWWLLPVGILIGLGVLAYSTGPFPLSHHGLGDVAVLLFFGIVPVTLTCYLQEGGWQALSLSLPTSVAIGLLAVNVLVVNNYRDMEDDRSVGKHTTVVLFGCKVMGVFYLSSGMLAMLVMLPVWLHLPAWALIAPIIYLSLHFRAWHRLKHSLGAALNPLLGETARNLLLFALLLLLGCLLLILV